MRNAAACSPTCGLSLHYKKEAKKAEKAFNAETRRRKDESRPVSWHDKKAQDSVNRYILLRDYGRPCISCNKPHRPTDSYKHYVDAGHFKRRGGLYRNLRFNILNIHGQCVECNRDMSGNELEYRKGLIERYGLELVDSLECNSVMHKMDVAYLQRVRKIFDRRAKYYRQRREQ